MGQCSWILCSKIPHMHSPLFQPCPSKAASSFTMNLLSSSSFWLACSPSLLLLAILLSFPPSSGCPAPLPSANLPLTIPGPQSSPVDSDMVHSLLPSVPFHFAFYTSPCLWTASPTRIQHGTSPLCSGLTALVQLKADPWHSMLGLVLWTFDSPRLPFTCRASHTQSLHLRPVSSSLAFCTQNLGPW